MDFFGVVVNGFNYCGISYGGSWSLKVVVEFLWVVVGGYVFGFR